jgi:hypothetical protein
MSRQQRRDEWEALVDQARAGADSNRTRRSCEHAHSI